jgi:hypothetical protein
LFAALLAAGGCSKDDNPATPSKAGDFNGPSSTLGNGTVRAYVKLDDGGAPTAIGIRFSETALTGLSNDPLAAANALVLALPSEGSATPFTHVFLNWNPLGHPPDSIYTLPHFDIHFYLIPSDERAAIMPTDTVKGGKVPSATLVPSGYVNGVEVVPMMGVHWVDVTSPEFAGQQFTRTLIWGYWDGKQAFIEPMITRAFIESKVADVKDIRQPSAFSKAGYYPTKYSSSYDATAKEYTIALKEFVKH